MASLAHMSDDELMKIASGPSAPTSGAPATEKPAASLAHISDEDLMKAAGVSSAAPAETISPLNSALQGAGQGLTFGYSDEGIAAAKTLRDKFVHGDKSDFSEIYARNVAKERADLVDAQKANPGSYIGGNVAGSLPTLLIPGLGIAREAGLAATLGKAALQGGLMASGESTANPLSDPQQFATDTAEGAAIGGATQGLFSGVGSVLNKLTPTALKELAAERAVKAATGQNVSALRKITGTTLGSAGDVGAAEAGIRKVGTDILDQGALGATDTVEDLAPKLAEARKTFGGKIGEVATAIDAVVPEAVDSKKIASEILDYASSIPETVAGKKLQERLVAEAANFEQLPGMSFTMAQDFKNQFKFKPVDADALISNQDATNKIRSIIGSNMDETAEKIAAGGGEGAELIGQYKDFKSKYGSFKAASDAATDRVQKNLSNRFVSPSDYALGIGAGGATYLAGQAQGKDGGSGLETLGYGALAAFANKQARTRGSSLAAVTAHTLGNLFEKSPQFAKTFGQLILDAAQRGPASLVATHNLLLKDDPQYRQQVRAAGGLTLPGGTP